MTDFAARMDNWVADLCHAVSATVVTRLDGSTLSLPAGMEVFMELGRTIGAADRKFMMIGNGASAAMASHFALDYANNGRIRTLALNDGPMLTALANDLGYEAMFARQIELYAQKGDGLVAISSSGRSANILRAVEAGRAERVHIVTFTGFSPDNPLRAMGDLNFFVRADEYGPVEVSHMLLLHMFLDVWLGWGTEDDRNPGARRAALRAERGAAT